MAVSILVATPQPAFGELIRLSLNEDKRFEACVVHTAHEARDSLSHDPFRLAILDADLPDDPLPVLYNDLLNQFPDLKLVIIPPENNPNHPALASLTPNGFLNRPFYLPDLIGLVERLTGQTPLQDVLPKNPPESAPESARLPAWLSDPLVLESCLEKQVTGTEVIAALVVWNGSLHAAAGSLNPDAAHELVQALLKHFDPHENADLMRFVRLSNVKGQLLAYVTPIIADLLLILVFEPGLSVRIVRPLTRQIAQTLAGEPVSGEAGQSPFAPQPAQAPENAPPEAGQPEAEKPVIESMRNEFEKNNGNAQASALAAAETQAAEPAGSLTPASEQDQPAIQPAQPGDLPEDGEELEAPPIDLMALLGVIPSPDPEEADPMARLKEVYQPVVWTSQEAQNGWVPETPPDEAPGEAQAQAVEPDTALGQPETQAAGETTAEEEEEQAFQGSEIEISPEQALVPAGVEPQALEPEPPVDPLEDTKPRVLTTINKINQLEPVSPAISLLNYTCVLIPRLPQHYLTGELAEKLAMWVQQMCVAYAWRLEGISIRPDYLQWTVQVTPTVSPGNVVRVIRKHTSTYIFNTYKHIRDQNPSGDFWALGYLIVSGSQPPSAQLLREYILKTRKRQGISKLSS